MTEEHARPSTHYRPDDIKALVEKNVLEQLSRLLEPDPQKRIDKFKEVATRAVNQPGNITSVLLIITDYLMRIGDEQHAIPSAADARKELFEVRLIFSSEAEISEGYSMVRLHISTKGNSWERPEKRAASQVAYFFEQCIQIRNEPAIGPDLDLDLDGASDGDVEIVDTNGGNPLQAGDLEGLLNKLNVAIDPDLRVTPPGRHPGPPGLVGVFG